MSLLTGVGWHWLPATSARAWAIYVCWFLFQLALYRFMPGPVDYGQPTNAGHTLQYRVNGWNAWWFSHACLLLAVYGLKLFPATIVADEWFALFGVLNVFGYFWTLVAYFKAWLAPTHGVSPTAHRNATLSSRVLSRSPPSIAIHRSVLRLAVEQDDCKWSGSIMYDMFMGVEHNPRVNEWYERIQPCTPTILPLRPIARRSLTHSTLCNASV